MLKEFAKYMDNNFEIFVTKKPKSAIVRKHIAYYYFHKITNSNFTKRIVFYPNVVNSMTIYENSKLFFNDNYSIAKIQGDKIYSQYYTSIQKKYRISDMEAPFSKIGIAFHPLGINFFIDKPLSELVLQENDLDFNFFQTTMKEVLPEIFETEDFDKKVEMLDQYFLSQFKGFNDEVLINIIEIILKSDDKLKVYEVANKFSISEKTLNRKFKLHLNCTAKQYIDICQFRKSFNHYVNDDMKTKLTELTYIFDYYDQSEFIKQFKKITGINPKKLFGSIERFGKEEVFWNTNR